MTPRRDYSRRRGPTLTAGLCRGAGLTLAATFQGALPPVPHPVVCVHDSQPSLLRSLPNTLAANHVNRTALERQFLENLPLIDRLLASLCRRSGLWGDDADDACSWVKVRLIENDYAMLAKFRQECSLKHYLAVVLAKQMGEYRVMLWGRWRPSAAATQLGPVATRLETLVYRDGLSLDAAHATLTTTGFAQLTFAEMMQLFAKLPVRNSSTKQRSVGEVGLADVKADEMTDASIIQSETDLERKATQQQLSAAIRDLEAEDQVIIRMRYWNGLSVADVARGLGVPQKPLYRRIERTLENIRKKLRSQGFSADITRFGLDSLTLPGSWPFKLDDEPDDGAGTGQSRPAPPGPPLLDYNSPPPPPIGGPS